MTTPIKPDLESLTTHARIHDGLGRGDSLELIQECQRLREANQQWRDYAWGKGEAPERVTPSPILEGTKRMVQHFRDACTACAPEAPQTEPHCNLCDPNRRIDPAAPQAGTVPEDRPETPTGESKGGA